ncbi:MAG: histone deacetylase [Syntrophales bacterium]|nr:histone deacetylase [Syntrophales bacterium]MDD5641442.1 histone deacetylase [Syntrophales bacterium]
MKKVGVYYHPLFKTQGHLSLRGRLADFPGALEGVLQRPNVILYECPRATREMILKAHPGEMVAQVDLEDECRTAYESAGGVMAAMEALAKGELDRAFCFTGTGGHHAGMREFYETSCFNHVVIALRRVREITPLRRLAIIDTDALHGGGTMQLLGEDQEALHLCFCRSNYRSEDGLAVEVNVHPPGNPMTPRQYLEKLQDHLPLVEQFQPDLLVWYCGLNAHQDDYASLGLTIGDYLAACGLLVSLANTLKKPLLVVLGGGTLRQVASEVIPEIIQLLAEG